ncbi:hypothetical protein FHQ28_05375 [Pasteurellaceae bacterium USgator11]|nr:hypothetical protein FHQ19_09425 [Pasteurellaceae bacterium UScroc12]TNG94746.1 hypothetical protein FHQ20_08115 [Pasteurellaceae bacterium USgator41]TNG97717.1 hypothetical protein FHQ24_09905 [Pasteurellaceae bacterium UScroc31]TNH01678.1 hypothetical protein FHQ28_05375 [Pasteurellaceae bacterium USgator11]
MRKIIQICEGYYDCHSRLAALCNDGTLWVLDYDTEDWENLPDIPQDEEIEEAETVKETEAIKEPTFDWDAIIRDQTLLRTRDEYKAVALFNSGDPGYPINGVIYFDEEVEYHSWALSGRFYDDDEDNPFDIVGYWTDSEETNNE